MAMFQRIDSQLGRLDGLVNNAGVVDMPSRVDEMTVPRLERMFRLNVIGSFLCAREAVRRMSTRHGHSGGVIVNLSSAAARLGSPGQYVDYAAAKGAIDVFTLGLATAMAYGQSVVTNEIRSQFAPSGTLRAGINYANPLLASRDEKTGELSGVAVDLSRELGRRLGVPVQLVGFDAAGKMTDAVKSGAWDIAFLGIDPARATEIDYSAAYMELEGTYLVPAASPLKTVEDVDREGVRVAVTSKSA